MVRACKLGSGHEEEVALVLNLGLEQKEMPEEQVPYWSHYRGHSENVYRSDQ